jgi:hypothetical protein
MEVATIIFSSKEICTLFDDFIYSYSSMQLSSKDSDTSYFDDIINNKIRLFYHYKLNDPEYEFSYNYPEEEIEQIKSFYADRQIYMFDLSYRPEKLLIDVLKGFKLYVKTHDEPLLSDILISHPFDGLKNLKKDY